MGIPRENVAPLGRPTVVGMPPYAQQGTAGDAATAQSTRATGPTAARTAQDEEYQFSEEPVHTDRRSTQDSEDRDSTTPSASPPKEEPVKKQEHRSDASSAASKDQKDASSGRGNGAGTGAAVAVAAGAAVVAGGAAVAVAGSANEDKKADSGKSNGPATQAAEKSGDPATDPNAIVAPPPREPPPMNDVLRQILTEVDDTIIPQGVGSDLVGRILMEDATRPYTRSPSTSSAGINSPSATPHTPAAPAQTLAAPVASEARAAPSGLSDKAATGKTAPTTTPTTATTDKTDSSTTNNARHHDQSNDVKAAGRQSRSGTKDGSSGGNAAVAAGAVAVGAAAVAAAVVAGSKSDSGHSKDTSAQDQRAQQSQPTSTATAQASTTGDGKGQEPPTLVKSTTSTSSQDDVAASQPQSVPKSEPAATTATSSSTASPATGSAVAAAATGSTEGYTSHRDSVTSQGSVHDQPARRRYQSFTHPDESDDDDGDAGKGKSGTASGRGSVYDNNTTTTPTPAGAGDDDDDDDGHAAIPAGIAGLTGATSGAGASDGTTTTGNVIDSVAVYHEPAPAKPKPMFHAHFRDLPPLSPHTLLRHLLEVNDAIEAWVRENIDKLMAMTEEGMKPPLLPKNLGDQIRPAAPPAPQEKAAPISIEPQPGMPVTTAGSTPTQVSTSPNDDGTSFLARKKAAILQKLKKKNSQQDVTQGGGGGGAQGPSDGDPFGSVESEAGSTGSSATPSGSAPAHDHKAHVVAYGGMPMQQHRRFDISGAPELAHSLVSVVASILMNGLKTEGIFGRITLWQCIRKFPNPAVEALLNYVEGFVWEGIPDVFLKYMRAALFIQIGLNQGWLFTHFARLCNNNPNFFDWYDPSAILRNPGNRTLFFNCLEQIQQKFLVTSELDTNMTLMYMPRTSLPATLRLGEAVGSKCLWSHGLLEASLNADLIERLESVVNSVGRLSSDVQAASALVTIQSATEDKEALDKMEFKLSVMVRRELADVLAEILLDGFKHFKIFGSYSLWDIFEFQAGQDKCMHRQPPLSSFLLPSCFQT
eukprot:TRINITY_DN7191_c0_g1_i7.p1 TRINITY_DN7191_c0_g1~~TRINITY_DN7191_c0_g1_i7.p1  ORF type:complete len:1043 (-),score=278.82 TRINITY_DN7191_c0_g1_i7:511-3639(-)